MPADSRFRPALRRIRRRMSDPPSEPLRRLLEEFASASVRPFFVQIGANDGEKGDYLDTYVEYDGWRGILVEPIPYVFEALEKKHGANERLTLVNAAIANHDGTRPIYYLPRSDDATLPVWYDALASFRREVIASHAAWIPDVESRIATIEVPTLTFASLCQRYDVPSVDLVQIDVEGYDHEVVKQIDLDTHRPAIVLYEHYHLPPGEREACERHLEAHGYRTVSNFFDTLAVRVDPRDRRARRLQRVLARLESGAALPDVRDAPFDFRFAADDSLPAGAAEYLSSDNTRLQELRGSYAALPWPVCRHSRWREDAVAGWLNLKYFRGDNIIMWHYRDEASVGVADPDNDAVKHNRLFYFTYLQYVLDQPAGDLVERLGEDGAFGCWVYAFPGAPPCSRDLLDSVNELGFLDKHLSVTTRKELRILDVGAGYGRLAHRASQALPGLVDYCCVDAVAESTFLAEYYTGMRQVVPPVRVVPLPEVPALPPDHFDLAVNVHSFSECTLEAIDWWMAQVARLRVPSLFVVPNEPAGFLSTEVDGTSKDYLPVIESHGYRLVVDAPAIEDAAVRSVLGIEDRFCLFERA